MKNENKSTSRIFDQVTSTSRRMKRAKKKNILEKALIVILCIFSVLLSILFIDKSLNNHSDINKFKQNNTVIKLMAEVKSMMSLEKKQLYIIEENINKNVFRELYSLVLFYYQTQQYEIAVPLIEFGLGHYKGNERKRFKLLIWLIKNSHGEPKTNVREAYEIAGSRSEDLKLLLTHAIENDEHLLHKNVYKKLRNLKSSPK